jgi:hypothetical protein
MLPPGVYSAKIRCQGGLSMPLRVRVTIQTPEQWRL